MDVSAVSLVVPEPSSPSKADSSASGAKQFEQLLAAGVGGPQAANRQDPAPVGRAPQRPEQRDPAATPAKDRPKQADKADKTDDDDKADRDRIRAKRAKAADASQSADADKAAADAAVVVTATADQPSTDAGSEGGSQSAPDGEAGAPPADPAAPTADPATADAGALAAMPTPTVPATAAPVAGSAPTNPAPVPPAGAKSPEIPAVPALTPTLPTDPAGAAADAGSQAAAAPAQASAQPAAEGTPAAGLAAAAAKLAAALAAGSEAAAKPASGDSSAASMASAGKTSASEALAQLNQQSADAVVRLGNGAGAQDPGQQGLGGNLARGNGPMVALDRAPLTGAGPTVATETLLFSQLEQAAQLDTSVEGPAPLPQASALGETGLMASNGASATGATPAGTTAAAPPAAPPPARPVTPVLLPLIDQVLPHFSQAGSTDGTGRFTINLRPPELGKVQVNLKVGADGHVVASIMADRQDTLSLLQRDSHLLEQALSDAGLTTGGGDLQFSLSGDSQGTGFEDGPGSYNAGAAAATPIDEIETPATPRQVAGLSLVDLHV